MRTTISSTVLELHRVITRMFSARAVDMLWLAVKLVFIFIVCAVALRLGN